MLNIKDYGYTGNEENKDGMIIGRITEVHRSLYRAVCEKGEVWARLKGSFIYEAEARNDLPAVGDFVRMQYNQQGNSLINEVLPRHSKFSRPDYQGSAYGNIKTDFEQIVAVNFDYVFIVSSLNQDYNLGRILRYVSAAVQSGGQPVIILSKSDLCEDWESIVDEVRENTEGIDVIPLSSHTGFGMERLPAYMEPGKTVVFLGMSGVGKSSLLNKLAGENVMEVADIREDDAKGRHTTTYRQLIRLESGAMIIDTPGMREIGLYNGTEGIKDTFSHIEKITLQCRFSDCAHNREPGCAVKEAIEEGIITQKQWKQYVSQLKDAQRLERKLSPAKGKVNKRRK